ncbi:MAG TPA: hypothetical protein VGQ23_21390 [Burkholderiaceae bacterium]|jgi:hypothetical protein|nr:hypothetical protein [Burkholderiaceae bacterium]
MVTLTMIHEATGAAAPAVAARVKAGARAVWRALESVGRQRARAHLERVAAGHDNSQPELARRLREAARHCGSY